MASFVEYSLHKIENMGTSSGIQGLEIERLQKWGSVRGAGHVADDTCRLFLNYIESLQVRIAAGCSRALQYSRWVRKSEMYANLSS